MTNPEDRDAGVGAISDQGNPATDEQKPSIPTPQDLEAMGSSRVSLPSSQGGSDTLDLAKLEEVARAATPGPWMAKSDASVKSLAAGHWGVTDRCLSRKREANALHIATFDPPTVLRLIERSKGVRPEGPAARQARFLGAPGQTFVGQALSSQIAKASPMGAISDQGKDTRDEQIASLSRRTQEAERADRAGLRERLTRALAAEGIALEIGSREFYALESAFNGRVADEWKAVAQAAQARIKVLEEALKEAVAELDDIGDGGCGINCEMMGGYDNVALIAKCNAALSTRLGSSRASVAASVASDLTDPVGGDPLEQFYECEGCPPEGYPTDETRCTPCPRRAKAVKA